ncbi:MAG TPA: uroporphyrinogen-III synthase [Gaiellaceae bacterium]|nr:uroporphyrinogen-III synthase [Gaiellaceae bacterium]
MRIVVTRDDLVERVEALGHTAVLCPLIRIEPLGDEPIDASSYDWLIVTSANGAHELGRRGVTAQRIAAIGPATAEALHEHGLHVDLVARTHTQEGLRDETDGRLLLAAAEGARQDVLGADFVPLYRTVELPQEVDADIALLMSGSAARALRTPMKVVAIGPQTADEARAAGHDVVAEAASHDVDGLLDALASLS